MAYREEYHSKGALRFLKRLQNGSVSEEEALAVRKISLSDGRLKKFPSAINRLRNLTTLDISWNQLSELPETIGNLTRLTTLDIHSNQYHCQSDHRCHTALLPRMFGLGSAVFSGAMSIVAVKQKEEI